MDAETSAMTAGAFLEQGAKSYTRNPLGILGLFVGFIWGIVVVVAGFSPNLTESQRWALVLFAALFPIPILCVFYNLVTEHHSKLYAPADWKDERHFFGPQSAQVREQREAREAESVGDRAGVERAVERARLV